MHRVKLVAAAALLALLAACGGNEGGANNSGKADGPAKVAEPQSGQCVAKEVTDGDDFAPDMRTVVPCSELHAYEIVAVVAIPDDMLAGTTDAEKLARRTELTQISGEDTELRKRLRTEVYSLCDEPFREATGLGQVKVVEKSAKDVDLRLPPGAASQWYNLSSPELWVKGTTQAVCSFRFAPPSEGDKVFPVTPVRSNNTNPAMSSYLTRKFPTDLRSCWDTKTDKAASCSDTHDQELLWIIDMKAVYGKGFLKGADLADVNDADFSKLADACIDPYEESGGGLTQKIGVSFRFFTGVPTTGKTLPIICVLAARDGSRLEELVAYSRF